MPPIDPQDRLARLERDVEALTRAVEGLTRAVQALEPPAVAGIRLVFRPPSP